MSILFGLPLVLSSILFVAVGVVLYGIARIVMKLLAKTSRGDPYSVPIGAFTGTIATAWALSLGFVAADVWTLNAQADRALSSERSAVQRLIGNASADVLNVPALAIAAKNYREAVITDEWKNDQNLEPSPLVENALQSIRAIIMQIAQSNAPQPIVRQTITIFDSLQDARDARLAIGNSTIDEYKWYLLFSLTLLTICAVAAVHSDRPRAGRKALLLYVMTATICLWILAIHANPYTGIEKIEWS